MAKEIVVGKYKIELKTEITVNDFREIEKAGVPEAMEFDIPFGSNSFSLETKKAIKIKGKDAIATKHKEEDKKIEVYVISVDGKTTGILESIKGFNISDFDSILKEIGKIEETSKKK